PQQAGGPEKPDEKAPADSSKSDPSKKEELTGKARDLDEHLEELTGKRRKKKNQDKGDGEGGPMSELVKQMREVEQRLGKPDTGEQTRQKQTEIVKNLEKIIEQLRNSSGQSQGKKKLQLAVKPGQQPWSQPGEQTGANPGHAPNSKPLKPTDRR